jgi:hypothetical protein
MTDEPQYDIEATESSTRLQSWTWDIHAAATSADGSCLASRFGRALAASRMR